VAKDILGWFPRQRGADSQRHGLLHAAPAGYVQRISAPRTRNGSRSGRISRNYLRFVYSVANVATVARVSGLRAFLRFTPEAGYNGYIGYKPVDQDVLGRAPPQCGEDSQGQGTSPATRARRASRLQTRDQCAANTY